MKRHVLPFAILPLTVGCSQDLLLANSSPAFAAGYKDGCASGTARASNQTGAFVRDEQRFLNDAEYGSGWRSGNRECDGENFRTNPNDPMQTIEIDGPQGVYER
jgi:hypothetical protein